MEQEKRSFIRRSDAVIILLLAAACLGGWLFLRIRGDRAPGSGANYAVLTVNDTVKASWLLDGKLDGQVIDLTEYGFPGKAEFQDGRVRVIDVDCPDKICESSGYIGNEFESAVCLPNRAAILIYTPEEYQNLR